MLRINLAAFILAGGMWMAVPTKASAQAGETGYIPVIVARGELKEWIHSMPIEARPNRPLHFYGNTVRRNYYRNSPAARPPQVEKASEAFTTQPAQSQ
jgi:hypothetical protein